MKKKSPKTLRRRRIRKPTSPNASEFERKIKDFRRVARKADAVAKDAMRNPNATNDATRNSIGEKLNEAKGILAVLLPRLEKFARSK